MDEEDITEVMARIVMEFVRQKERRDTTQRAVKSVVKRVSRFNGDEVPKMLTAYMTRDVDEAIRLEYFCQVVAVGMHGEVKEL